MVISEQEKKRYSRQMIIPGWGEEGQKRIKDSTVFIAGAGGLGSPASFYLAMAGVGKIRICDFDKPELSNLNRQFLHDETRLDMNKAESAKKTLARVNPHVDIEAVAEKIDDSNAERLVGDSTVIIDCMDNFPTRFLLNRVSVKKKIPFFHGAIWGFEGRNAFFHPPETACFACFYKDSPPREEFPVLGTTPGIIGVIQAVETLKYITGVGSTLKGRYLCSDFSNMDFFELPLNKNPQCPVCQ